MTAACYREPTNGAYFTRDEHHPLCDDTACRGCKPCPGRHCTARRNCTWHLDPELHTCGECLGTVRKAIRDVADLTTLMLPEAVASGVESEATNLAGPATDPRHWSERRVAMRSHLTAWWQRGTITEDQALAALTNMPEDDDRHPGILMRWQMMIAEDYDHELPRRLTITGAADYLDRQLHRIANDERQDFTLLRREVRKCRSHLEAVLHNSTTPTERGVPCPDCKTEPDVNPPRLVRRFGHWCERPDCTKLHYSTRFDADLGEHVIDTTGDVWICPRNPREHKWSHERYESHILTRRKTA